MEEINPGATPETTLTVFDDYAVHEQESATILNSGRELFGENFIGKTSGNFPFTVPGITSDPGKVRLSFAGAPPSGISAPLSLQINETEILKMQVSHPASDYKKSNLVNGTGTWNGEKKEQINVGIFYNSDKNTNAFLDYIVLNMKRQLRFYNNAFTFFRSRESLTSNVKYSIDNANTQSLVWDVTANYDTKLVKTTKEGNKLNFSTQKDNILHEYVMVDYSKPFPVPVSMGEVKNQDLHATTPIDMAIIVPEAYFRQAEQLAERHRKSGLKVLTVQSEWIYNEFSSGNPDATAYRRFMKMFYDRAETEAGKPKYLLFFGDGLFDNRHLTETGSKMDPRFYLLSYQVAESTDETGSYGTDDYFGFLDDNEGSNIAAYNSKDNLDLGIGRFPVSSVAQAEAAVHKVLSYMDNNVLNKWKNQVIFTADDADTQIAYTHHVTQADEVARSIEAAHPQYMIAKSYMDAFKPVSLNGKKTYPDAKKKLLNTLKEGCFMVNYTGHGGKAGWSGEDMLNIADVRQMNFEGLPLWITATCDFGWFDGSITSGGEEAFLNKNGGAIALFTTSRVVYSSENLQINRHLVNNLFPKDRKWLRLGDILRKGKNELTHPNKLNYVLLGDPAMILNYPKGTVELEKINGEAIKEDSTYLFRTLEKIVLEGKITENGSIASDFNGQIQTTVFDSRQEITTNAFLLENNPFAYTDYLSRIFIGTDKVENGKFTVSFTVPLDISYNTDNAKINFYAYDENTGRDANGYCTNYALAASDKNPDDSENGPEIRKIFLNSEQFENGGSVNETPFFVAQVFDEHGINMSGNGLGHDITICIDNSPQLTYSLNSYYTSINGQEGELRFSIPELSPGTHTLVFKVWNILNVSSKVSLNFNVEKGLKPNLYDITATNVPARDFTNFRLIHDRPESIIDVEVLVYDMTGRMVWSRKETGSSSWLKQYSIEWNLTNGAGQRVEQGIYLFKAIVNAPEGKETTKAKKIIVLKQ
jgi:hypothetical protein